MQWQEWVESRHSANGRFGWKAAISYSFDRSAGVQFSATASLRNKRSASPAAVPTAIAIVRLLITVRIIVIKKSARSPARNLIRSGQRLGSLISHAVTISRPAKADI